MSSASVRMEADEMVSAAASDMCSEESFGTMASPESSRLGRASKLARFKDRQLQVLQALSLKQRQQSAENDSESEINRQHTPDVPLSGRSATQSSLAPSPRTQKGPNLDDIEDKVQSRQLAEMLSEMTTLSTQLSDQKKHIEQLASTTAAVASQKSLNEFMQRMDEQHKTHVAEMHHLQRSFPTESECEGLRVELNASKKRQHSLEQQQVLLERSWAEEKATLEKEVTRLRARESNLVQQMQQVIVEAPETVEVSPPYQRRKPGLLLGLGLVGLFLAGMVAHWWHRPSPEAFHKETGLGQLKGIHLRGKGVCRAAASSTH